MRTMISKFGGVCTCCKKPFAKGTTIKWSRMSGALCATCAFPESASVRVQQVAPCWKCQAPEGRFRSYGAATPVYCDKCEAEERAKARFVPDFTDTAYEDACARACGLDY